MGTDFTSYINEMEAKIPKGQLRTRFAPSPTGYMHIGNLRTALYEYLLAKKAGGKFILRIEDTDLGRSVDGAIELIYDTMKVTGITYDEGPDIGGPVAPYIQSERRETYKIYAELLIGRGHAYRCFCDKDALDEQRKIHEASRIPHKYDGRCAALSADEIAQKLAAGAPYVVRQKMPRGGATIFNDVVYGRIEVDNSTLDDQILLKTDGMPTYNFANVVDDHLMGITHILRGNEFLASTPKYTLLYEGYGWPVPEYIHVPPVMKDATQKLSKRNGDAAFSDFIEKGYLVQAVLNYIALLGWNPGDENEIFTIDELVQAFDVKGISKSPAIFDYEKLRWLNGTYLRKMGAEAFHAAALPFIRQAVSRGIDTAYLAGLLHERCEALSDIPAQIDFIDALPDYDISLFTNKKMKTDADNSKTALDQIIAALEGIGAADWGHDALHGSLYALIERMGVKNGQVLYPLRVAVSGKTFTPGGGIEICILLGRDESLERIRSSIDKLS